MLSTLEKCSNLLSRASLAVNSKLFLLGAAAIVLMALPTTIDVCGGFFGHPMASAQELVEFFQVVVVFGCIGYIHDQRGHIYVEIFFDKFSKPVRYALEFAFMGVMTIVFGIMVWRLYVLGVSKLNANELSLLLSIPVALFVLFAAFCAASATLSLFASALHALVNLLKQRHGGAAVFAILLFVALLTLPWWAQAYPWMLHKTLLGALGMAMLLTSRP